MPELLAGVFVAAQLAGLKREYDRATRRGVTLTATDTAAVVDAAELPPVVVDGVPQLVPADAVAFFRGKVPLRSRTVEALVARAKTMGARVAATYLADVHAYMDDHLGDVIAGVADPVNAIPDLFDKLEGVGLESPLPSRLETIIRTNTATAYQAGRLAMLDEPEMLEAFPYLLYDGVDDSATREEHLAMQGKAWPVGHGIWNTWMPPNGYN